MKGKTVAVTGALGHAGRVIVACLETAGYQVIRIDRVASSDPYSQPSRVVDLTHYGDALASLHGADEVVHFGSDPWPDRDFVTGAERYRNNTIATFNVFQAACQLGIGRVVYASSETIQGHPFLAVQPRRIPILETDEPMPQTAYALSKLTGEHLAHELNRMHGTVFLGLRCANILYDSPGHMAGYDRVPSYWSDPKLRRESLWKYVDVRDVAEAVLAGLKAPVERSEAFNISAADTLMTTETRALFSAEFPETEIGADISGFATPVSLEKAARLLGWRPRFGWRDHVAPAGEEPAAG